MGSQLDGTLRIFCRKFWAVLPQSQLDNIVAAPLWGGYNKIPKGNLMKLIASNLEGKCHTK